MVYPTYHSLDSYCRGVHGEVLRPPGIWRSQRLPRWGKTAWGIFPRGEMSQ
jgi:hypothetical protein